MESERLFFSVWQNSDLENALELWGNPEVTKCMTKNGRFSEKSVIERLKTEITCYEKHNYQYWPIFEKDTSQFVGCCGIHPYDSEKGIMVLGIHLLKSYWGIGYSKESVKAVVCLVEAT